MSTKWDENRPQRIVEQWRARPLGGRTAVGGGALATMFGPESDVKVNFIRFSFSAGGNRDVTINVIVDGATYTNTFLGVVAGPRYSVYLDVDTDVLVHSGVAEVLAGNQVPWFGHSFEVQMAVAGGIVVDKSCVVRFESL